MFFPTLKALRQKVTPFDGVHAMLIVGKLAMQNTMSCYELDREKIAGLFIIYRELWNHVF